jgi:hypothetical protein
LKLPEFALQDIGSLSYHDLTIHVEGSMRDVNDKEIAVDETFRASEWWRTVVAAQERVGGRRKLPGVDPNEWGIAPTERPSQS